MLLFHSIAFYLILLHERLYDIMYICIYIYYTSSYDRMYHRITQYNISYHGRISYSPIERLELHIPGLIILKWRSSCECMFLLDSNIKLSDTPIGFGHTWL